MDNPACHVIYVNHNVGHDRLVHSSEDSSLDNFDDERVRDELLPLLEAFGDGMLYMPLEPDIFPVLFTDMIAQSTYAPRV